MVNYEEFEKDDQGREIHDIWPGCNRCGCSEFFVGDPFPAEPFEKLAEDRYIYRPVFGTLIECVNCGYQTILYESE